MTTFRSLCFAVTLLFLAFGCATMTMNRIGGGSMIYVSNDGNDSWSGKRPAPNSAKSDGPFATLTRARDEIRRLKSTGHAPSLVNIRGGKYYLGETFSLEAQDSGTKTRPIVYRAYRNEKPIFTGGKAILGFAPVKEEGILNRIDPAARGFLQQVDLNSQGISGFGIMRRRGFGMGDIPAGLELFYRGEPMELARWPNSGWSLIKEGQADKFTYDGDRPKRWTNATDIWVHGYWSYDWAESYESVKKIDADQRVIETELPHGVYGYKAGQRFYALNILEELDSPGEWYLDRNTGILYFWPPAPLQENDVVVSILESLMVKMQDVSDVMFQGLSFEDSRASGFWIQGGERVQIRDCAFRNLGNRAVGISGGKEHSVLRCQIENVDDGVSLDGGDRKTFEPAKHQVCGCTIRKYSRWSRTYHPAITLSGVGNRAAHNLISEAPHMGIAFGGNDHVIEFNEIHHLALETGDVGAMYIGRNWTMQGNMIRHNFVHHINGLGMGSMGVYLDDLASGTTVFGNVFYKTRRAAFIGGGRDNTIENNIFVDCEPAVHVDQRGKTWTAFHAGEHGVNMTNQFKELKCDEPPYSVRYPKLASMFENDPYAANGNVVARNICVGGRWIDLSEGTKELVEVKDNLLDEDPRFIDAGIMDFRLKDDSPAYKLGFQRIPFEQIGPAGLNH